MATNVVSAVSAEECIKVLQNKLNRKDFQFINVEQKPISDNVEGLLGEHFSLFITYEIDKKTKTEECFIKIKPTKSDVQIQMCNDFNAYQTEIFMYDTLFKEFDKYGYDTSFAAKLYFCVPEKYLILENLVRKGYVLSEKQTPFELTKIKCTLKALALFHAAGFAYQETKSKELGCFNLENEYAEYFEESFFIFDSNSNSDHSAMRWFNGVFKTINKLIDLLPEDENYKSEFKDMFNNFPFGKTFKDETKLAKTCGHGDLWSNNMLFKYENNVPVDCKLLDFQICRYFHPCFDVLLSIFGNVDSEIRDLHLDELYEYYYEILGETLKNYGYSVQNILPKEDFYASIRLTKADAMLQVLGLLSLAYLPIELFTNMVKDNTSEGLKDLMQDNVHLCSEAFINDPKYSKILASGLKEMRNALLALQ